MKRSVFLGLALLMTLSAACLDPEVADVEDDGAISDREHHPFYVAVFDHAPTEDEIQADLTRFLVAVRGEAGTSTAWNPVDPVPLPLQPGQKLVRIDATTSNIPDAGTEKSNDVRFDGRWQRSNGQEEIQSFVLNHPTRDDLDRNTVNIFYYVLNVGQNVTDRFMRGRITNSSTDGWHCNNVALIESNRLGTTRSQALPFNQWVDYPGYPASPWLTATNTTWLTY